MYRKGILRIKFDMRRSGDTRRNAHHVDFDAAIIHVTSGSGACTSAFVDIDENLDVLLRGSEESRARRRWRRLVQCDDFSHDGAKGASGSFEKIFRLRTAKGRKKNLLFQFVVTCVDDNLAGSGC